jgi:IrrE N-terminal-like domain
LEEIEQQAETVLAEVPDWIWNGEELPVPVENIADSHFGLLIRDVEDMTIAPGAPELRDGQSLSGLLLAGPGEIWVNAEEARQWPGRRRFTIGHELGHWVMHRAQGQQSLFCRHAEVDEQEGESEHDRASEIEREANAFAAAFTMPAHLIREHYERLRHEPDCHARLCKLFNSSGAAMGHRLHAVI